MPKKEYALENGGPKRVLVSWSGIWKNMKIHLDGELLGGIENSKALKEGRSFDLPDGGQLQVRLVTGLVTELQVSKDGTPLPGSSADPEERVRLAYLMIFFVGGLNGLLGLITVAGDVKFLDEIGVGWGSIALGAIYSSLGIWVKKGRSTVGLVIAVALFALDAVASIALVASAGGTPPLGTMIARGFLLVPMVRGVPALRALKMKAGPTPRFEATHVGSRDQPWEPPKTY